MRGAGHHRPAVPRCPVFDPASENNIIMHAAADFSAAPTPRRSPLARDLSWLDEETPLRLRVWGASMMPALWPGETVEVMPRPAGALAVGDLAVFARDGHFIVHRVTAADRGGGPARVTTCGDANCEPDPPLAPGELIGQANRVHRFGAMRRLSRERSVLARALAVGLRHSPLLRDVLARACRMWVSAPPATTIHGEPQRIRP